MKEIIQVAVALMACVIAAALGAKPRPLQEKLLLLGTSACMAFTTALSIKQLVWSMLEKLLTQ